MKIKKKDIDYNNYFLNYEKILESHELKQKINKIILKFKNIKKKKSKIIFLGNGGSAASASHLLVDLTKNAITAFANDYGYENYLAKALKFYCKKNDLVVFISVSGNSRNLVNALKYCNSKKIDTITFTGTKKNNYLFKNGKLNIHIDSMAYNIVECTHLMLLTYIVDCLIGKAVYRVN